MCVTNTIPCVIFLFCRVHRISFYSTASLIVPISQISTSTITIHLYLFFFNSEIILVNTILKNRFRIYNFQFNGFLFLFSKNDRESGNHRLWYISIIWLIILFGLERIDWSVPYGLCGALNVPNLSQHSPPTYTQYCPKK